MKKHNIAIAIVASLVLFQNCSKVSFKKTSGDGIENPQCVGSDCGPNPTPSPVGLQCFGPQIITQPGDQKKLDLLFVIDTSDSLDNERAGIADNISSFIDRLPADVDYNIAVLLAHAYDSNSGKLYRESSSNPLILKKTDYSNNLAQLRSILRTRIVDAPTEGRYNGGSSLSSGGEAGIYGLNLLLNGTNLTTAKNQGFFRDDSGLAIVFLSDEDDLCFPHPQKMPADPSIDSNRNNIPDYEESFKTQFCSNISIAGTLSAIGAAVNNKPYFVSGIVHAREDNISTNVSSTNQDGLGTGYIELVNAAQNRLLVDMGETNMADALSQIGQAANSVLAALTEEYKIREPITVDPSTVKVRVDGTVLQNSQYTLINNIINFNNNAGHANSRIEISYCGRY